MAQPQKRNKKNTMFGKLALSKRVLTLVPILLFAGVGAYLVFGAKAEQSGPITPNPIFACISGYDMTFSIDTSGSNSDSDLALDASVAKAFVNQLVGTDTQFIVIEARGGMSSVVSQATSDAAVTIAALNKLGNKEPAGGDDNGADLHLQYGNPRPDKQDIFFFLSDGNPGIAKSQSESIKGRGGRMLAFVNDTNGSITDDYPYAFGPRIDTGDILKTDIITIKTPVSYQTLAAQLGAYAKQSKCQSPPGGPTLPGPGPGGPGPGPGNGPGPGPGTGGTGPGQGPGGGGGGGSTANKQGNQPNTIPSSTGQGTDNKQPELNPSPFFDGKEYKPGSDTDTLGSTVTGTGKKLIKGWYFVVGAIVLGGLSGVGYWYWRQKHKPS